VPINDSQRQKRTCLCRREAATATRGLGCVPTSPPACPSNWPAARLQDCGTPLLEKANAALGTLFASPPNRSLSQSAFGNEESVDRQTGWPASRTVLYSEETLPFRDTSSRITGSRKAGTECTLPAWRVPVPAAGFCLCLPVKERIALPMTHRLPLYRRASHRLQTSVPPSVSPLHPLSSTDLPSLLLDPVS
jgi:hypothetical protein